tara:strand:- start:2949 stop:3614 length:666 start_codon:yes stop_codon:yes gene_type:complete
MSKEEDDLLKYWLLNRPDRLPTFILDCYEGKYDNNLRRFWNIFRDLWIDGEFTHHLSFNTFDESRVLKDIFLQHWESEIILDSHKCCEGKDEYQKIVDLWEQEKVCVYRGQREDDNIGVSWTLDKDRANWFANRFYFPKSYAEKVGDDSLYRGNPTLLSGWVKGASIISYFDCRGEDEVLILDPNDCINDLKIDVIKAKQNDREKEENFGKSVFTLINRQL